DITIDFVTSLLTLFDPRSNKPYNTILVIIDKFTKYTIYIVTTKALTASTFVELFFDYIY
ncbi:hypothetical protein C8A01DRAFT_21262, partial [Parachaetomium inaequale]